ncbi:uncharacterized protein LOC143550705 [Bidens hawaiensis]|uniref:uncharacterized protein LOC143550705 n=1 Tax=Bidens hawaiensis TaxID=980011 RepID=UPI0040492C85
MMMLMFMILSWIYFCFDNDDGDEVDLNSVEDWSGSEQDYEKDVEDEDYEDVDVVYPCYVPNVDWKLAKPVVSMKFESPAQLKDMLTDYGVANGHQLVFTVNDHNRLLVRCGTKEIEDDVNGRKKNVWKCLFRLWASRNKEDDSFQIKSLNDKHTCSRKFYLGSLVTYTWIAKRFFKQIIQNPEISYRKIQEDILKKYQCKVSHGQCGRAKDKVLDDYEGGLKEHYARLSDYQAEILETNPGSTVRMAVETMPNGEVYFSGYYICFKAVKDGYSRLLEETRIIIFFLLAWAVVSVENKENWNWFLNLLRIDIEMEDGLGLTLISDQHKGITEAVKDVFPNAEHRHYEVTPSGKDIFEVRSEKNAFVVKIREQTCTCRSWKLSGIPCVHTVAALGFININPETFVSNWFTKDMFKEAYKHCIKPLKGSMHWPKIDDIKPLPTKERRMPGRPSVKRKRDPLEKEKKNKKEKNKKVGTARKVTCQNYKETGHNIRSCTKEKKDPQPKVARAKGRNKKEESRSVSCKGVE